MRSRALAFFLALVMAWMGFSAQEQAAEVCSDALTEQFLAAPAPAGAAGGSLDDHHLDNLPFQLLADLLGLLGPGEAVAVAGLAMRPDAPVPSGWLAPHLARLQRPPIATIARG
ncbi:hypothetical protein LJR039_001662 [Pseudorhodoferax sp. LjRoot39]|uniref:hypothetical protein n=1 Tax=Pseudorhodoferax sp. LjRoot39 TaxID=3342328 RepID=UPI003ECE8357